MKKADVSLEKGEARVEFEDTKTSPESLKAAVDRLGFQGKVLSVVPRSP